MEAALQVSTRGTKSIKEEKGQRLGLSDSCKGKEGSVQSEENKIFESHTERAMLVLGTLCLGEFCALSHCLKVWTVA